MTVNQPLSTHLTVVFPIRSQTQVHKGVLNAFNQQNPGKILYFVKDLGSIPFYTGQTPSPQKMWEINFTLQAPGQTELLRNLKISQFIDTSVLFIYFSKNRLRCNIAFLVRQWHCYTNHMIMCKAYSSLFLNYNGVVGLYHNVSSFIID